MEERRRVRVSVGTGGCDERKLRGWAMGMVVWKSDVGWGDLLNSPSARAALRCSGARLALQRKGIHSRVRGL